MTISLIDRVPVLYNSIQSDLMVPFGVDLPEGRPERRFLLLLVLVASLALCKGEHAVLVCIEGIKQLLSQLVLSHPVKISPFISFGPCYQLIKGDHLIFIFVDLIPSLEELIRGNLVAIVGVDIFANEWRIREVVRAGLFLRQFPVIVGISILERADLATVVHLVLPLLHIVVITVHRSQGIEPLLEAFFVLCGNVLSLLKRDNAISIQIVVIELSRDRRIVELGVAGVAQVLPRDSLVLVEVDCVPLHDLLAEVFLGLPVIPTMIVAIATRVLRRAAEGVANDDMAELFMADLTVLIGVEVREECDPAVLVSEVGILRDQTVVVLLQVCLVKALHFVDSEDVLDPGKFVLVSSDLIVEVQALAERNLSDSRRVHLIIKMDLDLILGHPGETLGILAGPSEEVTPADLLVVILVKRVPIPDKILWRNISFRRRLNSPASLREIFEPDLAESNVVVIGIV